MFDQGLDTIFFLIRDLHFIIRIYFNLSLNSNEMYKHGFVFDN